MIVRHLHIERRSRIPKILSRKHRALLANKQCSTICIAVHIIRADRQIRDLEALDAMHVEALVNNAVLDDGVSVARGDGARAERVPGRLNVALDPLLDGEEVIFVVLEVLHDVLAVGVEVAGGGSLALLCRQRPRSVLEASSDVAGQRVGVGGREIEVLGAGRAVKLVEWVHGLDFAGVGIHAARCLTRLDVGPDHGRHVAPVVHEAGVEVRSIVWVG